MLIVNTASKGRKFSENLMLEEIFRKFLEILGRAGTAMDLNGNMQATGPFQPSSCKPQVEYHAQINKKAQLSLTNPRDACGKFARFT